MNPIGVQRRDSLFDSRAEEGLFRELDSRWSPKLRLFPQTPLRSVLEIRDAEVASMKTSHLRYFRSASLDYTFAEPSGRPMLSVEFDGIGGGYGRGTDYLAARRTSDRNRRWKLEFKLRAAARAGYPLFVISFEETEHFEEEESVTILDGIIGQFFSRQEEGRLLEEMIAEDKGHLARLSASEAHEHIEDLLLQASVQSDLDHDPLTIAIARESQHLLDHHGLGTGEAHYPWMYDPPAPDTDGFPPSPAVLEARLAAFKAARRVGARFGVARGTGTDEVDYVHAEVWIRNLGQEHGLLPEMIATQLAHLCALRKLRRTVERDEAGITVG